MPEMPFDEEQENKPGCAMPIIWVVLAGLVVVVCGAFLGISASGSESAGVMAANLVCFPASTAVFGALSALVVHFVAKNIAVRIGVPVVCGCLGGVVSFMCLFVFFTAIWPSL